MHRVAVRNGSHTYKLGVPFKKQMRPYLVRLRHQGLNPEDDRFLSSVGEHVAAVHPVRDPIPSGSQLRVSQPSQSLHGLAQRCAETPSQRRASHSIARAVHPRDSQGCLRVPTRGASSSPSTGFPGCMGTPRTSATSSTTLSRDRRMVLGHPGNQHVHFWLDSPLASSRRLALLKYGDLLYVIGRRVWKMARHALRGSDGSQGFMNRKQGSLKADESGGGDH